MYRFMHCTGELFRFDDQLALCLGFNRRTLYFCIMKKDILNIVVVLTFNGVWNLPSVATWLQAYIII